MIQNLQFAAHSQENTEVWVVPHQGYVENERLLVEFSAFVDRYVDFIRASAGSLPYVLLGVSAGDYAAPFCLVRRGAPIGAPPDRSPHTTVDVPGDHFGTILEPLTANAVDEWIRSLSEKAGPGC